MDGQNPEPSSRHWRRHIGEHRSSGQLSVGLGGQGEKTSKKAKSNWRYFHGSARYSIPQIVFCRGAPRPLHLRKLLQVQACLMGEAGIGHQGDIGQ